MSKLDEIKKALQAATTGPWVYDDIYDDIYADKTDVIVCYTVGPEDGRLIANAPEWLGFLLSELERLEQERNMYKASSEVFYERLKKVDEEREKLVECLRFYERLARGREVNDGGRRARTLLAEIGVTVE